MTKHIHVQLRPRRFAPTWLIRLLVNFPVSTRVYLKAKVVPCPANCAQRRMERMKTH